MDIVVVQIVVVEVFVKDEVGIREGDLTALLNNSLQVACDGKLPYFILFVSTTLKISVGFNGLNIHYPTSQATVCESHHNPCGWNLIHPMVDEGGGSKVLQD